MMKQLISVALLNLALSITGCSDKATEPEGVKLGEPFTIRTGQTVEIPEGSLSLRFERVVFDGRCPTDPELDCFWEGMAGIELSVDFGPVAVVVAPTILGFVSNADTARHLSVVEAGYRFTLRQLDPPPSIHAPLPQEYTAIIEVADADGPAVHDFPPVQITELPPASIHLAPFFLHDVRILADTLTLDIGYSGGCQSHYHFLFMSPAAFQESDPVQANLYLRHVDNGDMCEAYITETKRVSVRSIADLHQTMYGSFGPIVLNVHEYLGTDSMRVVSVIYHPEP
jgi:hypothetical protein